MTTFYLLNQNEFIATQHLLLLTHLMKFFEVHLMKDTVQNNFTQLI